jgi:AcrR family transcriptional regulator
VAAERGERRGGELGELGPLPGGHHGLSREQILESQRERLLAAIAQEVAVKGYRGTTITDVVKLASVSTRDFYEHFDGKEACFLAAFEAVRDHLEAVLTEAAAGEPDWPHQAVTVLRAALEFFAAEPDLARLCLVESQAAGPVVAARFHETVREVVPYLEQGRGERAEARNLPATTEDSTLGALVLLASRKVAAGETEQLEDLLPEFAEFILAPYVGAEDAARFAHSQAA